jgi:hypothetical protein
VFRTSALSFFIIDNEPDAEEAAADRGMMQHPLDLNYMGVQTIWANDLGMESRSKRDIYILNSSP